MEEPSGPRVLFLITARGGSKGLPGKNLMTLGPLSLIGWKAATALRSRHCARLIISTDSPALMEEAVRCGAEAPFLRPPELATDTAGSAEVVAHAVEWLAETEGAAYDAVMLLQPTNPFATAADYDAAVAIMVRRQAHLVLGLRQAPSVSGPLDALGRPLEVVRRVLESGATRRQDARTQYTPNGSLYLMDWAWFRRERRIYADPERTFGYVMDDLKSVDIDTEADFRYAEYLVERGYVDLSQIGHGT